MKTGSKFQGAQQQIACCRPCFQKMPDKGRYNRKQENMTTHPGDRFKPVHNGGIQQSSHRTGSGWLRFLIFRICFGSYGTSLPDTEPENKHCQKTCQKKNTIYCPGRNLILKTEVDQICMNKYRACMIGKRQKIFCFIFTDSAVRIHIREEIFAPMGYPQRSPGSTHMPPKK